MPSPEETGNAPLPLPVPVDGGKDSEPKSTPLHSPSACQAPVEHVPWPRTLYGRLKYVPPRCRYDPDQPFEFSMGLNLLFGTWTVWCFATAANFVSRLRRMFHRCKSLLHSPDPEQAGSRFQCYRRAIIIHSHVGASRLCCGIAVSVSAR